MTVTNPDDYSVLHSRDRLADDGTPALSARFLRYLDGDPGATRPGNPVVPLTLDEARARLAQEYPELAAAVDLCCVEGQTVRGAATVLGIDYTTVHKRRRQGVAQLAIWTGLSVESVDNRCRLRQQAW